MITNTPVLWTTLWGMDVLYLAAWLIVIGIAMQVLLAVGAIVAGFITGGRH